jgi:hypothetical protein
MRHPTHNLRLTEAWSGLCAADIEDGMKPGYQPGFLASIANQKPTLRSLWIGFFYVQERMMLATPEKPTSPAKNNPALFERFFDGVCLERLRRQQQPEHALSSGVNPAELCRYAAGAVSKQERREIEGIIRQEPWAMTRVSALVKAARDTDSLAAALLQTSKNSPDSRSILETIKDRLSETVDWEDPELSLARIIHAL